MKAILPMATAKAYNTRTSVNINLFGALCELKELQLPTYTEIMRHYYWLRNENRDIYLQPMNDLVKMVGEKFPAIWTKASITVVLKRTVNGKIWDNYNKCRSVKKSLHCRSIKEKKKCEKFIQNAELSLFNISACKCKDLDYWVCEKSRKVPKREIRLEVSSRSKCSKNVYWVHWQAN